MTYRVEISGRVLRDLETLYLEKYVSDSSAATHWFEGLREAIASLGSLPNRCPLAPESADTTRDLHQLLCGNKPHFYRIIHEIDEKDQRVGVYHIRHGARQSLTVSAIISEHG